MKAWRIIALVLSAVLLTLMQFPSFVHNENALPFPHAQRNFFGGCSDYGAIRDTLDPGFSQGCMCTMVNIPARGFPFRNDIYDPCRQDGNITWYVQAINWMLQLILAGTVYVVIVGIGRRMHRAGSGPKK